MNKSELIDAIADSADISKAAAGRALDATVEAVKKALSDAKIEYTLAELNFIPQNTIALEEKAAEHMLKLMEILDEHDDVQKVHANFDISDEVMEKVAAATA